MRPNPLHCRSSQTLRLAMIAAVVLLISVKPAQSYTWLGPFPDVGVAAAEVIPKGGEAIPPLFEWPEAPKPDGVIDLVPPEIASQNSPEPATIIASLIGAGALGLVRVWRKRRGFKPLAA